MSDTRPTDRRRWYVVQTKPRQDARAESNLRRWNIQTFAPHVREQRRTAGGEIAHRVAPLFPSYLFARFDAEALGGKIRLTRGIQRIIGFGEYATPVDDAIIRVIEEQIGDDGLVRPREAQPGDAVEIIDGPLRSLVGVFERHTCARDRVVILLTTIGCRPRVEIEETAIRTMTQAVG
jgi:transcriptional antiterminator RfaH